MESFETETETLNWGPESSRDVEDIDSAVYPKRTQARNAWLTLLKESPLLALTVAMAALFVIAIVMAVAFSAFTSTPKPLLFQPPPMGWSTAGPFYKIPVTQADVMESADALVSSGLADAGYKYVIVDEGWADLIRDTEDQLLKPASTFPAGMAALADYVHSKGLKLGLYSAAGYASCEKKVRQTGSFGYEDIDARTFASWGVDYLKYDDCTSDNVTSTRVRYEAMGRALKKAGRPIYYAMCDRGASRPWEWAKGVVHSWRTTVDIADLWDRMTDIADFNDKLATFAGPGAWNDPDLLQLGNPHMKLHETMSQLSIWALMKAPLVLGSDVTKLTPNEVQILTNPDILAINRDALGVQGRKLSAQGDLEVWAGPLTRKRVALALWNRGKQAKPMTAFWTQLGLDPQATYSGREIWTNDTWNDLSGSLAGIIVESHRAKLIILTPSP